jgi:hypothetical protein
MNPKQVAYFPRRLEKARADLWRELAAGQPSEADDSSREGNQTGHASAGTGQEIDIQLQARPDAVAANEPAG